jgi:hypothetical protein
MNDLSDRGAGFAVMVNGWLSIARLAPKTLKSARAGDPRSTNNRWSRRRTGVRNFLRSPPSQTFCRSHNLIGKAAMEQRLGPDRSIEEHRRCPLTP